MSLSRFAIASFPRPALVALTALFLCLTTVAAQAETRIVMLGTGTPVPDGERAGQGVAVVVNERAYVFDAGGGVVKNASLAFTRHGIEALNPQNIEHLFITHLHSDHIHDVSELASARWWGRQARLRLWGPAGIVEYVEHMDRMNRVEADIRSAGTPPQLITHEDGYEPVVEELEEGVVFENGDIEVEAFRVPHGEIKPSFGYKVTTADRSIVISGDTTYSPVVAEKARGADILIHEVASGERLRGESEFWQEYHGASHTTTDQLAEVADSARPGLLVLTHVLFLGASEEDILEEVRRNYDGDVVLAQDMDIFD